jgi:BTB/POZ domain.
MPYDSYFSVSPLPPSDQLLELKWANFQSSLAQTFAHLRQQEDLVDVTLVCDGQRLYAHKLVLCAASPWFKSLLMVKKSSLSTPSSG